MRLAIKATTYRGLEGFLIFGTDTRARKVSVFVPTRAQAEEVKRNIQSGRWAFEKEDEDNA